MNLLYEWKHAWALLLVLIPLGLATLAFVRRRRRPAVVLSATAAFRVVAPSLRVRLRFLPMALRIAALVLFAVAIARPRTGERYEDIITHGVDMMIAMDVSGSMRAEDFRPRNRLHVAKEVVRKFVVTREHDRLGLVVFAGKAFTQCPLTLDYGLLGQFVDAVDFDSVDEDGTAIGMAVATSLNRLRSSNAKSRVVVLVTDGINNRGAIDPLTAAQLAQAIEAKIYTVGVGTRGKVPIPVQGTAGRPKYVYDELPLDEATLERIAEETGGYYFRATDADSFEEALRRIGELETTRIETREYVTYDELFLPLLIGGFGALGLEAILGSTWLRRLT